ncbi:hypothetical protein [Nitratifractor sp.]|uniref:hypothetical protein n=1 Tax=Nitratifractor sp. TaxID=2268144 RepID=UPI0025CDF769|nr:hypothetical protein [Nitratifractor sp.]
MPLPAQEGPTPTETSGVGHWFGFSIKSLMLILLGIVAFGFYVSVLLFGENSLAVLRSIEKEKRDLQHRQHEYRQANQRLQKQYFELLQITGE